jgi:hypothetical protein
MCKHGGRSYISFLLNCVTGAAKRESACIGFGLACLQRVHEFMREKSPAFGLLGRVRILSEYHVAAGRVCAGVDRLSHVGCSTVGVDSNLAEVVSWCRSRITTTPAGKGCAKALLHFGPNRGLERLPTRRRG